MEIRRSFDRLAKAYEQNINMEMNNYYERPAMLQELPWNLEGCHVLDAGCAAGWYTEQLLERGAKVTAIDLSPEMVAAAQKRLGDKATVVCHNLSEPFPFLDSSFDLILSSLTLHYIEDWIPPIYEFHRVLKKGGKLLYSIHHPCADVSHLGSRNYFENELLHDVWDKGEEVEVTFFQGPLHKAINDTLQFFALDKLVEPQPQPALKEAKPELYEYLMTHPHFLIVSATQK